MPQSSPIAAGLRSNLHHKGRHQQQAAITVKSVYRLPWRPVRSPLFNATICVGVDFQTTTPPTTSVRLWMKTKTTSRNGKFIVSEAAAHSL
jgi:hypothetical protein